MRKRRAFPLICGLACVLPAAVSRADWNSFDNFDGLTAGQPLGQAGSGWTVGTSTTANVVTVSGSNKAAVIDDATVVNNGANPVYKGLGGLSIPNTSSAATVFLQMTRLTAGTYNFNIGLADVAAPTTTAGDYEVQFNFSNLNTDTGFFRARDAGNFRDLTTANSSDQTARNAARRQPQVNALYNLWFVVNNASDSYSVYIQSDDDANFATQTLMRDSTDNDPVFGFRNGAAANALTTFLVGVGSVVPTNADDIRLDNLYVDTGGLNLTNPVPEPSALSALALGAGVMLRRRKR